MPGMTTVAGLNEWLKEHATDYPDMLTASVQESVAEDEVTLLLLEPEAGASGIGLSTLRLLLTLPDKAMPAYTIRAATADGNTPPCARHGG